MHKNVHSLEGWQSTLLSIPAGVQEETRRFSIGDTSDTPLGREGSVLDVDQVLIQATLNRLGCFEEYAKASFHQINNLRKAISRCGLKSIALESGHVYANEEVNMQHLIQLRIAGFIQKILEEDGISVKNILFVDDYHFDPNQPTLALDQYLDASQALGWEVDQVVLEKEMAGIAKVILETLTRKGETTHAGNKILLARGKAELLDKDTERLSCSILDAAFSIVKFLEFGEGIVNILPKKSSQLEASNEGNSFKGQQMKTRAILRRFLGNNRLPFYNIFIESDNFDQKNCGRPHWI
ncbi:MAG: hypothetical protein WC304_04155 [Candidatus Gracilibacteria bacterium]|jgi:hypothetical protein